MMSGQCGACKHYWTGWSCTAFPGEIPVAIREGEHDHRQPYPGDSGTRFELPQDTHEKQE